VAFAFALATLVSTQPLFVPHIDSGFLLEHFLGIWRDYFVECAVMAACPLLALTLAEAASDGAGRGAGLVALLAALHQAEVARVALSRQMMEARLQDMRAQIEPHFLFNTLANVKRLCHTDAAGGVTMLDNLTRCLRAALPQMREAQTTLGQEADLVQAYLAVLQIRMGGWLRHAISMPSELRSQPLPPMMPLPLVYGAATAGWLAAAG